MICGGGAGGVASVSDSEDSWGPVWWAREEVVEVDLIGEPRPLPAPVWLARALGGDLFSAFLEARRVVAAEVLKREEDASSSASLSFSCACLAAALEEGGAAGLPAGETDGSPFLRPPFFWGDVAGETPAFEERGEARWFRGVEGAPL